jgi:hypothetical protein
MDQAYRHSTLTISALDSENSYGGLFRERNVAKVQSCPASLRLDESEEVENVYVPPPPPAAIQEIDNGPLSIRGWALQERFLSPGIVCFRYSPIFWKCFELQAEEAFPHGTGRGLSCRTPIGFGLLSRSKGLLPMTNYCIKHRLGYGHLSTNQDGTSCSMITSLLIMLASLRMRMEIPGR